MDENKKLKIIIDREECIGDSACEADAPNTFAMDDDNKAIVVDPQGDDMECIQAAAEACPVECIRLIDEATGQTVYPEE